MLQPGDSPGSFPVLPRIAGLSVVSEGKAVTQRMRATIYAQFNPIKTMSQLIGDRSILRVTIVAALVLAACC